MPSETSVGSYVDVNLGKPNVTISRNQDQLVNVFFKVMLSEFSDNSFIKSFQ